MQTYLFQDSEDFENNYVIKAKDEEKAIKKMIDRIITEDIGFKNTKNGREEAREYVNESYYILLPQVIK